MTRVDLLVLGAAQVVTMDGGGPGPKRGPREANDLGIVEDGAIAIHRGRIVEVDRTNEILRKFVGRRRIFCRDMVVLPGFVDCHTHIDKGHIWPRKPNPDGSFMGSLLSVGDDRAARWSAADVSRRMDFSLRTAYAHGTKALRTHLDSVAPQEEISWPVFEEMRERWAGRIELQAACLTVLDSSSIHRESFGRSAS